MPEIGSGVGFIDQYNERYIGEKVYREVQRQLPVTQNPWLEDQLMNAFSSILSDWSLTFVMDFSVSLRPQCFFKYFE